MRVTISKSKSAEQIYITKAYRNENGKSTSRIVAKLGSMDRLLPQHDFDRDKVLAWAKEQAQIYTDAEKKESLKLSLDLSENKQLAFGEVNLFGGGYLFLQKIFYQLGMKEICTQISKQYRFTYDLSELLCGLVAARILAPASKLSSFDYFSTFVEQPKCKLHDVYRALDVLDKESDNLQAMLYQQNRKDRNTAVLYYDCTNFFFEIEEEKGMRKYGRSKEHRPNPIVQMGLFLDGDGIPLAFTIFSGNESEQPTLIPLEKKILKDYDLSKFIVCTDAGLASYANRKFNDRDHRSYVVTQPIKILKAHLKDWVLDPCGFHLGNSDKEYDISQIDEQQYRNSIFYKERWIHENGLEQRLIVTYSPKSKYYQREVRARQIERAAKLVQNPNSATRNQNSPDRFIAQMQMTLDGEVAEKCVKKLDHEKIAQEEQYDGFYAVCTTLEDDIHQILKINKHRWEIEAAFRMMKSEFRARPVYVQKDERIRAHFMTCFLALMIFRTLEKRLGNRYTSEEILATLRGMQFQKMKGLGYLPCYTRTEITDALHEAFGFRTDKQIITDKKMKEILKSTKK